MKIRRIFLVRCPRCKNTMKYATTDIDLSKKYKKCVYCGQNIRVKDRLIRNPKNK